MSRQATLKDMLEEMQYKDDENDINRINALLKGIDAINKLESVVDCVNTNRRKGLSNTATVMSLCRMLGVKP